MRSTASPLCPGDGRIYIVSQRLLLRRQQPVPSNNPIPVSFQSIQNSEVWWAPGRRVGVAARPMSRSPAHMPPRPKGSKAEHGHRGRMYTLVTLEGSEQAVADYMNKKKDSKVKLVAVGDVNIVHTWPSAVADEDDSNKRHCPIVRYTRPPFPPFVPPFLPPPPPQFQPPPVDRKKRFIDSDVEIHGDLSVAGVIKGRLWTTAADFAEFLEGVDAPPGSLVALRGGRITLDTSKGPLFVVSTRPCVAANVGSGVCVAMVGQVPVRCVGPVKAGDTLVPSGRRDGTAKASVWGPSFAVALEDKNDDLVVCLIKDQQPTSCVVPLLLCLALTLPDHYDRIALLDAGLLVAGATPNLAFYALWALALLLAFNQFGLLALHGLLVLYFHQ